MHVSIRLGQVQTFILKVPFLAVSFDSRRQVCAQHKVTSGHKLVIITTIFLDVNRSSLINTQLVRKWYIILINNKKGDLQWDIKYLDCHLVRIQVHKIGSDFLKYKFFSLMHDDFLTCFKYTNGILRWTPAVI